MMKLPRGLVFALLLFATAFAGSRPLLAADPGAPTAEAAWIRAFVANDLDGVMATYSPEAVAWFSGENEAKGQAAIRASYQDFFASTTVKSFVVTSSAYRTVGETSVGWGTY